MCEWDEKKRERDLQRLASDSPSNTVPKPRLTRADIVNERIGYQPAVVEHTNRTVNMAMRR